MKGCDASVLLNSKGKNTAEKDGPPNQSLHAFYVIDDAKKAVEALCPAIVSCADILAFAARDAVVLVSETPLLLALKLLLNFNSCGGMQTGGPYWKVPKGRKDGRTSKASETIKMPFPTFNISQLKLSFSQRGLSLDDLVALSGTKYIYVYLLYKKEIIVCVCIYISFSGGHTLGFSHCASFQNRIHNFNATHDVDPTMHPSFAARLKSICSTIKNAGGTSMDPSSTSFDNTYYKLVMQGKGLFSSDQALLTDQKTKNLVSKFANSKQTFYKAFVNSIIKMSSINGGHEIRKDCRVVN